jgi:hypothetical protein
MSAGACETRPRAIDGTKVKANASKHKAISYERMAKEEVRLKAEFEQLISQAERSMWLRTSSMAWRQQPRIPTSPLEHSLALPRALAATDYGLLRARWERQLGSTLNARQRNS